jgi:arginine decarboxylase
MDNNWTIDDSKKLYQLSHWGAAYFDVNEHGNMVVCPQGPEGPTLDLKCLVDDICLRGLKPPLLLRFNDILHARIKYLADAFQKSIETYNYNNTYKGLLPIKVNQQRHVVEEAINQHPEYQLGLEAGSKPEVLIAMGLLGDRAEYIICNGYKDQEYIETVFDAQKIGLKPFLVIDRFAEIDLIIETSKRTGVIPNLGVRAKLTAKGAGRWESSSGDRSKFGLSAKEIVLAIEKLEKANLLPALKLLHFHIGSQITSIRSVKIATREASHIYCNLRQMGATQLEYVDVGGGLAVDYDGSKTNFHSSKNYSLQEYANDIVSTLADICDDHGDPHPKILSESGRALVAHHSVLVFNVLGTHEFTDGQNEPISPPDPEDHHLIRDLWEAYTTAEETNVQEIYNDLLSLKDESATLFSHGVIDLETRAKTEDLFWATAHKIAELIETMNDVPDEFESLEKFLSDTFYCNFSIFQSLPDSWAVGHLFPILPIHRLHEKPIHQAVLADLTCDSDGKVDKFIDRKNEKPTLPLHKQNGSAYYLGAFLVGAYQETLGDLHNLFGDTNAVHVNIDGDGSYHLDHVVVGDTVSQVLTYVEYDCDALVKTTRKAAEKAVRANKLTIQESAEIMHRYNEGLNGYTYLED